MPQTENGLDTEIIAQSCCMAHRAAQGLPRIPFDQISDEDEARWQRWALRVEGLLLSWEGADFQMIALPLARSWWRDESVLLDAKMQLVWQAVARHLAMLLDSDELPPNLQAREESWKDWTANRLPRENS